RMFRRAASTFGRVATSLAGVQVAAAAVALTDKELSKKPEWYQIAVRSVEDALKRTSKYGYIESGEALEEAHGALTKVGDLHNTEIQWRIARILFEKAELSKNHDEILHLLHEAKDHAKKALAVEPAAGSAGAHKWYALILTRLAKLEKKPELEGEATKHLEKAVKIDSKDPYALHLLGVQQYNSKDYSAAVASLQKAETIKAGFSAANLYYLGAAQKAAGKKNEAIVNLKAAVQANPKNRFDGKARSQAKSTLAGLGLKPHEYEVEDL
ncbi:hypothetical protein PFISCL1PPCAC_1733, partial [Pristionchus fissidentatus]